MLVGSRSKVVTKAQQKVVTCRTPEKFAGAEGLIQPRLRTLPMPLGPLGRTASSEGFQDGGSLTRKMSERASKPRATRDRNAAIASIAAGAQKDTYTFSTTLHGCLATPSCGLAVNADNVITAVLEDSPATARMHVHAHWVRIPASWPGVHPLPTVARAWGEHVRRPGLRDVVASRTGPCH